MKRWMLLLVLILFSFYANAEKKIHPVGVGLYINDITQIKAQQEFIELAATVTLHWQVDKRFKKDQYFYGSQVDQALKKIWWPYFKFLNSRGGNIPTLRALKISKDGKVEYVGRYNLVIETPLNMHHFPFDTQIINISIVPFALMPEKIIYYNLKDKNGIAPLAHLDEWKLDSLNYSTITNNRPQFQLTINYQRKAGFYIYKVFLPLLVIILISYLVLWIPKQPAINRIAFIITAMLTTVAFQWAVTSDVPRVSYITYFQAMLLFAFIFIGSKAILVVIGEHVGDEKKERIMWWSRILYPLTLLLGAAIITAIWF